MPQSVPQDLPWAWIGLNQLHLDAWLSHSTEWGGVPVGLLGLLPHDNVEGRGVLVAEDETGVVVIDLCVDEERAAEVHPAKRVVA